jgi:hypothetical protein
MEAKKKWVTPEIIDLDVEKTSSGANPSLTEVTSPDQGGGS